MYKKGNNKEIVEKASKGICTLDLEFTKLAL